MSFISSSYQIAALLECGVFTRDLDNKGEEDIVATEHGIESAPLVHWAYQINDDRYDHVLAIPEEENPRESLRMSKLKFSQSKSLEEKKDDLIDDRARFLLTQEQLEVNKSIRMSLRPAETRRKSTSSSLSEIPEEFCTVTRNDAGLVVVSWYNAEFGQHWVDLAAVANRGTYTVPDFCPVSKARLMCE